jgi:hypothetical protein
VQAATFRSWETWAYDCTADPVQLWLTGAKIWAVILVVDALWTVSKIVAGSARRRPS